MRPTHLFICLGLLLSCMAGSVAAFTSDAKSGAAENGIWTGNIGDNKVMACLLRGDANLTNKSAYFYLRHAKAIDLIPAPGNKAVWLEGSVKNSTGIWTTEVQGDRISGTWSNPAKSKSLPILLNRLRSISSSPPTNCDPEQDLFDPVRYPQILAEKLTTGAEKSLNGRRYRLVSALDGAVKSVELLAEGETIAALNTLLLNELRAGISAYYGCPVNGQRYEGKKTKNQKPDYDSSIEPVFWNRQWLSLVARNSGDCGGAYPFSGYSYSTWDLSNGKELNLWSWIEHSKKPDHTPEYENEYFSYAAPERLNKIITKKAIRQRLKFNPKEASEENNCLGVIKLNSEYKIRLGKTGLVFTQAFPHVVQACTDDIEISYAELQAFLSKKAKAAVTAIQENSD
jgi:hypothetical protein